MFGIRFIDMLVTSDERFEVDDRVVGSVFRSNTAVIKKTTFHRLCQIEGKTLGRPLRRKNFDH